MTDLVHGLATNDGVYSYREARVVNANAGYRPVRPRYGGVETEVERLILGEQKWCGAAGIMSHFL